LDNFGARYFGSSMGRFMSPDPKHLSAHLSDPQSFDRYAYARNNPLLYVDPNGKDFEKAVQDAKTFLNSMYAKMSVSLGYEAKAKLGTHEARAGVGYGVKAETSPDSILKISKSVEGGASVGPLGYSKEAAVPIVTVNNDKSVTYGGPVEITTNGKADAGTGISGQASSDEKLGIGAEVPIGLVTLNPEIAVSIGGEAGATKEGWQALLDIPAQIKDSLQNPGPPPAPPSPGLPPGASPACPTGGNQGPCQK
jgi:hypothetical protein